MAARKQGDEVIIKALGNLADGLNKLNSRLDSLETRSGGPTQPADQEGPMYGDEVADAPRTTGFALGTSTDARNHPVSITKGHDLEGKVDQDLSREMKPSGPALESLPAQVIQPCKTITKEKAEMLRFMEEPIEIMVHDTNDPNADPLPHVTVNGVNQYFFRGERQTVKRKYVQLLVRPKTTSFGNEEYTDARGNKAYRWPAHTAPELQITILHDPSGAKGLAWFDGLRAEAA